MPRQDGHHGSWSTWMMTAPLGRGSYRCASRSLGTWGAAGRWRRGACADCSPGTAAALVAEADIVGGTDAAAATDARHAVGSKRGFQHFWQDACGIDPAPCPLAQLPLVRIALACGFTVYDAVRF